jgi:hypothetical protein
MDFSQLKNRRKELQEKLEQEVAKLNQKGSYEDDRLWKLDKGKDGNASATIRFLMAPPGEDFAFVRYFRHAFKGPGGWLMENCLTTLGKDCPVNC